MEGGRRAEAESSSAAARAPPEISDDLAEEAKAEFGVGDDEDDGDNEVGRDEGEEPGADGFVPSPLIPLSDQVEKDKVLIRFGTLDSFLEKEQSSVPLLLFFSGDLSSIFL